MMSSAKDRQAKRRAKIKENSDLYKANLEKDRKRKSLELANAKAKMSNAERGISPKRTHANEEGAARKSAQHDAVGDSSNSMPYQSSQSLGKAVKRARMSLPMSPRKQWCVVGKFAESVGLKVTANDSSPSTSTSSHGSALSDDTKKSVHEFYHSDILWQTPGRKDRIIIRETSEDGERVKRTEQVRFMLMSLREAYKRKIDPSKLALPDSVSCDLLM